MKWPANVRMTNLKKNCTFTYQAKAINFTDIKFVLVHIRTAETIYIFNLIVRRVSFFIPSNIPVQLKPKKYEQSMYRFYTFYVPTIEQLRSVFPE